MAKNKASLLISCGVVIAALTVPVVYGCGSQPAGEASLEGKYSYSDFEQPSVCGGCHLGIYQEWQDSLMAQSFTHEWDEVEYFKLALPHALKLEKVSGVKSGCIACHGPLAYLAGDIPPSLPSAGTRVNEGVSCEVCHSITGSSEDEPFNFSFTMDVGDTKYGPRADAESTYHESEYSEFTVSPEMCATCHDEQSPYGAWVKETYREWKNGPYSTQNVNCQDCHMGYSAGTSAVGGKQRADVAHHTFLGAHATEKLENAVTIGISPGQQNIAAGGTLSLDITLQNAATGHYFPTGSTEERMLWLEVWATDSSGNRYHIPVVRKGFSGEEYTIADSNSVAYQDIGEIMEIAGFAGLSRDGDVPDGARIFRRPFLNPEGEMTICQWYTENNTLVDYRLGPGEIKSEKYSWQLPQGIPTGSLRIEATLYFSLLPSSVGEFFNLPDTEYEPMMVAREVYNLNVGGEQGPPATTQASPAAGTSGQLALSGRATYQASCACHGGALSLRTKMTRHQTAASFMESIKKTMPPGKPGSLSNQQYLEILAHILVENNAVLPEEPFNESRLGAIMIKI